MNYRDALQIVIGEATKLNDEGALSDFDFEMLKGDVDTIDDAIATARSASRGTATGEDSGGLRAGRDSQ